MVKKSKKRPSSVIDQLISQVDALSGEDNPSRISVQAACSKTGICKETYYYRKRVESDAVNKANDETSSFLARPVSKKSTADLMEEFMVLEKRMEDIKRELSKRMD